MRYVIMIGSDVGTSVHGTFADKESAEATAERWQRALDRQYGTDGGAPLVWAAPLFGKSAVTRDRLWGKGKAR